ncbi:DUF294 nucleotidyltransferase-like domain-containing protein [Ferrimonas lipolytica]|uniref:Cyclic nucleotide-binding/CBS domain-containing protein n=1 Tax=Ferrimonas lipolytica TaxID=2724191 RepID=A0A6H1UE40_9GAMM|nr:DUF294 nucleotidyltransferase-like domain-containing protein [Ferrimonas lipolytica]QIZ76860.1 cyclic nucleotide-binding/CBS domain-containing protein [Ferrimonas lipolytica]
MTLKSNSPVLDFYQQLLPFNQLSDSQTQLAVAGTSISYFAKANKVVDVDYQQPKLYVVRSGAFEIRDDQGQLLDRIGEGEFFGYPSLLTGEKVSNQVRILEDGIVYVLTEAVFTQLSAENRQFGRFFNRQHAQRLRHKTRYQARDIASTSRTRAVMSSPVLSVVPTATVQQAAALMAQHCLSALVVLEQQTLMGIITDRDLRNRILAKGLGPEVLVSEVMTTNPTTIDADALVFEATLMMGQHRIHHLPVMADAQVIGMITSSDLLRLQSTDLLHLVRKIGRSDSVAQLIEHSREFPALLQQMITADARAEEVGRVLTQLTDSLTRRLLELAQLQLGVAPMGWCWLAFGSQARMDQAGKSDQDNGLLLAHEPDSTAKEYFSALATIVCDGLNACGYVHCPGGIMALNPKWCLSIAQWQRQFTIWIDQPEPKATMHASIFFDMRPIAGNLSLGEQLQQHVLQLCSDKQLFFAQLAGNAMKLTPPLGFFRQLVLEADGEHGKALDLKHRGLAPINDIGRIYALACGSNEVNTLKRLQAAMEAGLLNRKDALNLADAHEFIAHLRLQNQGRQWQQQQNLSNYLSPKHISDLVRHQLKQAFLVVNRGQDGIRLKYQRSL